MARDRIISGNARVEEESFDSALRPQSLAEMIGQRALMEKLTIAMAAARKRG